MGQVGGRKWLDDDGFVAAGLVQISDGSLRKKEGFVEERKDGDAMRRERRRKDNEGKNKK